MDDKKRKEFNDYKRELDELYEKNSNYTLNNFKRFIQRLRNGDEVRDVEDVVATEVNEKKLQIYLCIVIGLIGLLNIKLYFIYLFGIVFFYAGFFIGMNSKDGGIIFLFTHGLTGLFLMVFALLSSFNNGDFIPIFNSPIFSDSPTNVYIYLGIAGVLTVIAFIYVINYNLSNKLKKFNYSSVIPLCMFGVAILMTALFKTVFHLI